MHKNAELEKFYFYFDAYRNKYKKYVKCIFKHVHLKSMNMDQDPVR